MILIDGTNRIILQLLLNKVSNPSAEINEKCGDFDAVAWHLTSKGDSLCRISLAFVCPLQLLQQCQLSQYLEKMVPEIKLLTKTEDKYKLSFQFNTQGATEEACTKVARLRHYIFGTPLRFALERFNAGEPFAPIKVELRHDENLTVLVLKDNLIVQFELVFEDDDDLLFAKILLQEFVDAKKHDKTISAAPGFAWKGGETPNKLFCEFVLFKSHTNPKTSERSIERLLAFRTYLHYHLKCNRTYLHSRMRLRVVESLKILNRAKTHSTGQAAEQFK
eukprot:NODE_3658_length_924_cov_107.649937_g3506_i0.p1 GENE.NODE_3658_length_924_cov_107.649937_g3506_i0~~NODE_3658_length_924_cov_107.649937_g3506_i0.p1  ORF type:complete len:277 (+),score=77.08 NODE_3658_length_924_cov_107.649937_g3506_i0:47-877(+)